MNAAEGRVLEEKYASFGLAEALLDSQAQNLMKGGWEFAGVLTDPKATADSACGDGFEGREIPVFMSALGHRMLFRKPRDIPAPEPSVESDYQNKPPSSPPQRIPRQPRGMQLSGAGRGPRVELGWD